MEAAELPTPPAPEPAPVGSRPLLGELLVREGHVTPEQLEEALAQQKHDGRRVGEILVGHGWMSTKALAMALAEQHGLDFIDLARVEVEPAAASLLTEQFARRAQVLPVRYIGDDLVEVAVADPTNLTTADDLRLALGVNTRTAVADASALEGTIARTYRVYIEISYDGDEETEQHGRLTDVLERPGEDAPPIELVNSILSRAISEGASDVHLDPQPTETIVRARIDGVLRRMAEVPKALEGPVVGRLKVMAGLDIAEKRLTQDGSFSIRHGDQPVDVRLAVVPTKHGEHVVLRLLQRAIKLRLPELGMSPAVEALFLHSIRQPHGAVITCGPTGSGKTTTLYAALDLLNEEGRAITTIEDPVEYQLPGVNQVEVFPKIGLTFARGLRTILRGDPDVLLIGEIRDEETAAIAVQAAMTGHLVLTTLHTNDAASSVARLKNMGIPPSLLANSVNCIVAQRLARWLCLHCREPYEPNEEELDAAGLKPDDELPHLFRAHGCLQCSGTGYHGRVAIYEVLPVRGRIRSLIEASTEEIAEAAVEDGMITLREDGLRLVRAGLTSLDELRRVVGDRIS